MEYSEINNNNRVSNFYKNNPHLNFDKLNIMFIDLLEEINNNIPDKFIDNINELLPTLINKNTKQKQNLNKSISFILNNLYNTSEIININTKFKHYNIHNNDIFLLNRINISTIIIDNIDINRNLNSDEIETFYNIINEKKCDGILLLQSSGISLKENYHIDYHNGNILIFVHNVNYEEYKIKIAIDIIDNLSSKIKENKYDNKDYYIDNSLLSEINKEYKKLIDQKEILINFTKETQKNLLSKIEDFNIPSLDSFLSNKFFDNSLSKKQFFTCNICNKYKGHNLKAIAAHKRGCKKNTLII